VVRTFRPISPGRPVADVLFDGDIVADRSILHGMQGSGFCSKVTHSLSKRYVVTVRRDCNMTDIMTREMPSQKEMPTSRVSPKRMAAKIML